ncbi:MULTISPECIES: hypothetical protein [Streptosporangium]|uniref:Uncharacterized protein n=1 Tax=Streptosporangium brasiliense TaxID=47480 RepID=A0ABT9RGD6_9ACTN|nr:hypothetical protein [Streptosporangium brasiliense]MDP9868346.1 hypothetical protein [Streptosporangium brasiliense]
MKIRWEKRFPGEARIPYMASEAFYTTAAQVLPTPLIALSIEIGMILRPYAEAAKAAQAAAQTFRAQIKEGLPPALTPEQLRSLEIVVSDRTALWLRWAFLLGLGFLAGETVALLAVAYRWYNPWTFYVTGASILLMIITAALIPLLRLSLDVYPVE